MGSFRFHATIRQTEILNIVAYYILSKYVCVSMGFHLKYFAAKILAKIFNAALLLIIKNCLRGNSICTRICAHKNILSRIRYML